MKSKQPKRPKHQQQQQQQQQQNQQQQQLRQINEGFIKTSVYGNQADRLTEKCIVVGGLERVAALNHQGTVGHCRRLLSECTVHAIHTDQLLRVYIEITGDVDASQFEQGLADIWKTPQLHVAVCHGSARDALVSESTKAAADAEAKDAKTADTVKIEDTVKDEGTVTQDNHSSNDTKMNSRTEAESPPKNNLSKQSPKPVPNQKLQSNTMGLAKFGNLKRLALPDSPDAKYPLHYLGRHLSVMPTAPFCLVCVFNGSEKDIKIGEEVTLILRGKHFIPALLLTGPMGENGVQRLFNTVRNFDVQFIMALRENGENSENDDKETPGAATWRYYEKIDDPNTGRAHQYQAKNEGYSSIIIESVTKGWLNLILANRNNNYPSSVHNASTSRSNGLMGVDRATRSRYDNTIQAQQWNQQYRNVSPYEALAVLRSAVPYMEHHISAIENAILEGQTPHSRQPMPHSPPHPPQLPHGYYYHHHQFHAPSQPYAGAYHPQYPVHYHDYPYESNYYPPTIYPNYAPLTTPPLRPVPLRPPPQTAIISSSPSHNSQTDLPDLQPNDQSQSEGLVASAAVDSTSL